MNGKRNRGSRSLYFLGAAGAVLLLAGLTGGAQAQGTSGGSTPPTATNSLPPALTGVLLLLSGFAAAALSELDERPTRDLASGTARAAGRGPTVRLTQRLRSSLVGTSRREP